MKVEPGRPGFRAVATDTTLLEDREDVASRTAASELPGAAYVESAVSKTNPNRAFKCILLLDYSCFEPPIGTKAIANIRPPGQKARRTDRPPLWIVASNDCRSVLRGFGAGARLGAMPALQILLVVLLGLTTGLASGVLGIEAAV